ncbi:MAG: hypothetical protein ABI837_09495 [Acidobacteriota bacterium]
MKKVLLFLGLLTAFPLIAQPLQVVTVGAPAINCVFNPTCKVTVSDLSAPIWTSGFLQSRNYRGAAGAPAAGRYVYEYRIDLRNVVGVTAIPYITSLTVNIGPTLKYDFNGDGHLDDVFVVTSGGLGTAGLSSAVRAGNNIRFTFTPPVAGGGTPGAGASTFFFGVVSRYPRHNVTAHAPNNVGPALALNAWAPNHP